jgi:hypothetical protein
MFCAQCGAVKDGTVAACVSCGHSTSAGQTPELVKRMYDAAADAGATLLRLGTNPAGELQSAYASLGDPRALGAGAALGVFFAIASMIAAWIATLRMGIGFQPRLLFAALLMGLVLFASMAGAGAAGRKLLHGGGSLGADVFLAGVALLPIGILLLIASAVGGGNVEVIAIAAILFWTYLLSILYVGVTRLTGIPEHLAPPLIAAMLLVSLWLSKVVVVAVGGFNPFGPSFG